MLNKIYCHEITTQPFTYRLIYIDIISLTLKMSKVCNVNHVNTLYRTTTCRWIVHTLLCYTITNGICGIFVGWFDTTYQHTRMKIHAPSAYHMQKTRSCHIGHTTCGEGAHLSFCMLFPQINALRPRQNGWQFLDQTCGLDDVFSPDDFDSSPYTPIIIYIPYIIAAI